MPNHWYCKIMGEEMGPMSDQQLREKAQQKQISPDSLIRRGTDGDWVLAERVKGLFDSPSQKVVTPSSQPVIVSPTVRELRINDVELIAGSTDRPHQEIGPITTKIGAMTALSKRPTIEEINFHLKEIALTKGANAVINVKYNRGISMSSWKSLWAEGTAVLIEPGEVYCPYCAELVKSVATKCKHCGERLEPQISSPIKAAHKVRNSIAHQPEEPAHRRSAFATCLQYAAGIFFGLLFSLQGIGEGQYPMALLGLTWGVILTPVSWDWICRRLCIARENARKNRWLSLLGAFLIIPILGSLFEPVRQTSNSTTEPSTTGEVIGTWLDMNAGLQHRVTIVKRNNQYFMEMNFNDGSQIIQQLIEKRSNLGRRFEELKESPAGDHWLIDSRGNLQLRDHDGLISTALKL